MPQCDKCSRTRSTAELRRLPGGTRYRCKDRAGCRDKRHRIVRVSGGRVALLNTSRIPDEDVTKMIRFVARHVDLNRVVVHVKTGHFGRVSFGRCYSRIPAIANLHGLRRWEWRYLITVIDDRPSELLRYLAHEAKHVEQFRERLSISEVRCRHFEKLIVRLYAEKQATPEGVAARTTL